jgi:hypothetical protein
MRPNEWNLGNRYAKVVLRLCAGMLTLAVWLERPVQAQEAASVHVHFAFNPGLSPRFTTTAQSVVETELSASLAQVCANSESLRHWTYDFSGDDLPQFQISVFRGNGSYFLKVELKHKLPATDVTDHWEAELFSPEYLSAHGGLPMNRNWIAPVTTAFQSLLPPTSKSGREILKAMQTYVALGASVVIPRPELADGQPAAVLPLAWEHYQDISGCHFLILFRKPDTLITLRASGMAGPKDFTPDAPHYKAIWVVHNTWQMGALDQVEITEHLSDLAPLNEIPSEFYLDATKECTPVGGFTLANN